MNHQKLLHYVVGLMLVASVLLGCNLSQIAPASTSVSSATEPPQVAEFKDPGLCPSSDIDVLIPERLPTVQWSIVDNPSGGGIFALDAISVTDIWAVGEGGNVLHYDGTAWEMKQSAKVTWLWGVFMLSADEGWAVGGDDFAGNVILHYVNERWSTMDDPAITSQHGRRILRDVDFAAPDKGWAVGEGGILHYDGSHWTVSTEAGLQGIDMLSADEGWAVGYGGTIMHYRDDVWKRIDSPVGVMLDDVEMRSPEDGWAVGRGGTALRFDGSAWTVIATPTQADLSAVVWDSEGHAWAVGESGTVLLFDGQTWIDVETPTTEDLLDVSVSDNGTMWAVGWGGIILHGELLDSDVLPPDSPVLEVIDNSDGDGSFSLNWQSVSDDAMYVLQEADESMCPVTMYFGPETSKQMPWKEIGTYYYRVSALDTGGWSGWSQIQSVEVTVPPPSCDLICSASPDREIRPYDPNHYPSAEVEITCESGSSSQLTSTYQDLISEIKDAEIYGTYFEAKRTYEDSGNTYRIAGYVGQDWVDNAWRVRYHIEVTGGVFGESPRTCGTD